MIITTIMILTVMIITTKTVVTLNSMTFHVSLLLIFLDDFLLIFISFGRDILQRL